MMNSALAIISILFITNPGQRDVHGFSSGPPLSACETMTPNHGADPQPMDTFPYRISTNTTVFGPGHAVNVTISGDATFKGFFIQATSVLDESIIGTFYLLKFPPLQKLLGCGNPEGAITHADHRLKTSVSAVWIAPQIDFHDIVFRVTVVQQYDTFWVGKESGVIRYDRTVTKPTHRHGETTTTWSGSESGSGHGSETGSGSGDSSGWPPLPPSGSNPLRSGMSIALLLFTILATKVAY